MMNRSVDCRFGLLAVGGYDIGLFMAVLVRDNTCGCVFARCCRQWPPCRLRRLQVAAALNRTGPLGLDRVGTLGIVGYQESWLATCVHACMQACMRGGIPASQPHPFGYGRLDTCLLSTKIFPLATTLHVYSSLCRWLHGPQTLCLRSPSERQARSSCSRSCRDLHDSFRHDSLVPCGFP